MRYIPVLHPFLFAAVPVLFLFAHNSRRLYLGPTEPLLPLALSLGLALLVWLGLRLTFRDGPKAGLAATLFLLLFFSWGHIAGALHGRLGWFQDWQLGLAFLLLFAAGCFFVARARRGTRELTAFLDIFAAVLLAVNLAQSLPAFLRPAPGSRPAAVAAGDDGYPDIYYIVPDGFGRSDILREIYGYDNSAFIAGLRARGFFVADSARANYGQTYLSLGSALSMAYVDSLARAVGPESDDRGPLVRWLLGNRVMRELRGRGYRIVTFASGYSGTEFRDADRHLAPGLALTEFQNLLLSLTPVGAALAALTNKSQHDLHRERAGYILERLPGAARGPGPAFVFAHLLPPHPPFVYGPAGEPLAPSGPFNLSDGNHYHHGEPDAVARYIEGYRGQVRYVERRLLKTVDGILAQSARPPVIIIHADHGPGSRLNHDDPRWTYFPERQGILYAILMPGRNYPGWHPAITPVNTFRLVFNLLFGDTLATLPDRSFFATWDRPYRHYDVDAWQPPTTEIPDRVAVVAFRQAETQPAEPGLFFERLVGRKLPSAKVGPVLLYLVDSLPGLDEAFARYQAAVAAGELPDLGEEYEYFLGSHGSDWHKVLALFFPVPEPAAVAVLAFRDAPGPPDDPAGYARWLVERRFPGAPAGRVYIAPVAVGSAEEAIAAYRAAVADGSLPDLGTRHEAFAGIGPDGAPVVALLFPAGI